MAFSLFKKNSTVDSIYHNGHIFTNDPEFPWATAVACKDGEVFAVGDLDAMASLQGDETLVVDLSGKYMFPGFIDVHDTPALAVFDDLYLKIDPVWDLDTVLGALADYAMDRNDFDTIFAYAYNQQILEDYQDETEIRHLLDDIDDSRPVVVLGTDGFHCWLNTVAYEAVSESMEGDCLSVATPNYILNVLSPFDYEEVHENIATVSEDLLDKGFTTVFNMYSPNYFDVLYQDTLLSLAGEGLLRHKLIGSLFINRSIRKEMILHLLRENHTNCIEISSTIDFTFLKLEVSDDEHLSFFSEEVLTDICLAAGDQGFHIHIDALDSPSLEKAYTALNTVRAKGYKKITLVIASDVTLPPATLDSFEYADTILTTWSTDFLNQSVFARVSSVEEAIENLTEKAAELIGHSDSLGKIQRGKHADFTLFDENPFDNDLRTFSKMHAALTIIDGVIRYDAEEESMAEMYNILLSQRL